MSQNLAFLSNENKRPVDVVLQGDALAVLKTLADESVHCVVTSTPYYGKRDYGVEGQIGLEDTPREFVDKLVMLFREARRVLRDDGTCWINLGDSYISAKSRYSSRGQTIRSQAINGGYAGEPMDGKKPDLYLYGYKDKDLAMIPHRTAIALQDDGWWVRSDIIWSKPNPMPESVTDRPTKSHEYVFLLAKSERYFYDADAIREKGNEDSGWAKSRARGVNTWQYNDTDKRIAATGQNVHSSTFGHVGYRNKRSVWTVPTAPSVWEFCGACGRLYEGPGRSDIIRRTEMVDGEKVQRKVCLCGRQDAWIQHFAAFPSDLIEPCILAGVPHKVCADCGAPYVREVESHSASANNPRDWQGVPEYQSNRNGHKQEPKKKGAVGTPERYTTGWRKTCGCLTPATCPGTVLDPFFGSGTTGIVAKKWARHFVGIELNPDYVRVGQARCAVPVTLPLFLEV